MENSNKIILVPDQKALVDIKTPKKYIKQRIGAGYKTFDYVETGYVIKILNEKFSYKGIPLWDFKVIEQAIGLNQIWVKGQLTIHLSESLQITKEQFGGSDIKKLKTGAIMDLANDLKSASSDALKKCASMVGVASDIYWKGDNDLPTNKAPAIGTTMPKNSTTTYMATTPQLKKIAVMCNLTGYDREALKKQYNVKSSKELTLVQAKEIIDLLESLPEKEVKKEEVKPEITKESLVEAVKKVKEASKK